METINTILNLLKWIPAVCKTALRRRVSPAPAGYENTPSGERNNVNDTFYSSHRMKWEEWEAFIKQK